MVREHVVFNFFFLLYMYIHPQIHVYWVSVSKAFSTVYHGFKSLKSLVLLFFQYFWNGAKLFKESCPGVHLWNVASVVAQKQLWPVLWKRAWMWRPLVAPSFWIHEPLNLKGLCYVYLEGVLQNYQWNIL